MLATENAANKPINTHRGELEGLGVPSTPPGAGTGGHPDAARPPSGPGPGCPLPPAPSSAFPPVRDVPGRPQRHGGAFPPCLRTCGPSSRGGPSRGGQGREAMPGCGAEVRRRGAGKVGLVVCAWAGARLRGCVESGRAGRGAARRHRHLW